MTEHLEDRLLHAYLDGALDPGEQAELEAHLSACPACSENLETTRLLFLAIGGMSEESLGRDLTPAILLALSPLPRWVPSVAIGELLCALGIGAALILGLGTGGIWVELSAASAGIAAQFEAASSQLSMGWERAIESLGSLRAWTAVELPELASAGMWAAIAIAALLLWFAGNGLVLGRVRPRISR